MINYGRELRIRANIRRKEKKEKMMEFAKNKKDLGRDKNSIEKSIREDKVISG